MLAMVVNSFKIAIAVSVVKGANAPYRAVAIAQALATAHLLC